MSKQGYHDACAYYCEQSVEKHLKALYTALCRDAAPKTNQLLGLARKVGVDEGLCDDLHLLELDYMATRYPDVVYGDGADGYDEETSAQRLGVAAQVAEWVRARLGPSTDSSGALAYQELRRSSGC